MRRKDPQRHLIKRETDLETLSEWVDPGSTVLDLGCGRGILLEFLAQTKSVNGVGVDVDLDKIKACVRRGVPAYMGDAEGILREYPDMHFDWVVMSRTLQELSRPGAIILDALRVGRRLAVGFVNYGYWYNRWSMLLTGDRPRNEVFKTPWDETSPYVPITVRNFEAFCRLHNIRIHQRLYLRGDWRRPLTRLPNLRAGYALYALER